MSDTTATLAEVMAQHGLAVRAEFVPFSRSRNAKPNPKLSDLTLNWRVTLVREGRDLLTTDYQAGIGHCVKPPKWGGSFSFTSPSLDDDAEIRRQCETGKVTNTRSPSVFGGTTPHPGPEPEDVVYSLILDGDVLNYPTFEEWASDFGYDADSRKAEAIYQACLAIALQLRNGLGETILTQLQEACRDY